MKGTRLWQAAGSPIIQGRSRTERAFGRDWLAAFACAVTVGAGAHLLRLGWRGVESRLSDVGGIVLASAVVALLPVSVAVAISRSMRWGKPWVVGMAAGAICAFGYLALRVQLPA